MNKGFFEFSRGYALVFVVVTFVGSSARGMAYLPLVGPPPLRFEKTAVGGKNFCWALPALALPVASTATNCSSVTNSIPTNNVVFNTPVSQPAIEPISLVPENLSTNTASQTRPANDLLVVTPEMLVDYFKPGNVATNAANVHVLFPVNFTPPASASGASSQAIYKSQ